MVRVVSSVSLLSLHPISVLHFTMVRIGSGFCRSFYHFSAGIYVQYSFLLIVSVALTL